MNAMTIPSITHLILLRGGRAIRTLGIVALCFAGTAAAAANEEGTSHTPDETPSEHRAGIVLEEFVYAQEDVGFPQCHASTLLELEGGELLCAFFGGTRERHDDVEIWMSRKAPGEEWTKPESVAHGIQADGSRMPTWNPVLFQPKGGDLTLFYKVGPNPRDWWGEYKISNDGGKTWSEAKRLPKGILGPIKNKPIQLDDGTILSGSSIEGGPGWRTHVERSTDGGETWTHIGPINDLDARYSYEVIQPTLLEYPDGRIQMLMRNHSSTGSIPEAWSEDGGQTWSPVEGTLLPNNNSGLDAVMLEDGRALLVYNHSHRTHLGENIGHKGRGTLNVAVSDDGVNWEAALVLDYLPKSGYQFSYPAVIQSDDGMVHITYTWHRRTIKHVVLDPAKLVTYPIGWPSDRIPSIPSDDPIPEEGAFE